MKIKDDNKVWGSAQYLILNGRIRKRAIGYPARERLMVRRALINLHYRYREAVPFRNPLRKSVQWLEFVVQMPGGRIIVLMFGKRLRGGWMLRELEAIKKKQEYLEGKGVPYLILPRNLSSQHYQIHIMFAVRKELRNVNGKYPISGGVSEGGNT
jgi:hypothetical protein